MSTFWPWSAPFIQMYCMVTDVKVTVSAGSVHQVHRGTHSAHWHLQPGDRGVKAGRASWRSGCNDSKMTCLKLVVVVSILCKN